MNYDINNLELLYTKYPGSIFRRSDIDAWTCVIKDTASKKQYTKQMSWHVNGGKEESKIKISEWRKEICEQNNLGKNNIYKIDDQTILVTLTKEQYMITDMRFLPLCKVISLFSTKGGSENAEYYASTSYNRKIIGYHNLITGAEMVDHINGIPLDNRLYNLRPATYSINNCNRIVRTNTSGIVGVRFVNRPGKQVGWQARIKINNKEITKSFSTAKYGDEEAKRLAIEWRQQIACEYQNFNDLTHRNDIPVLHIDDVYLSSLRDRYSQGDALYKLVASCI